MILGGSTTSLLSLINCLDPEKYKIDLLLQSKSGPLYKSIPDKVNILPSAAKYGGKKGKIIKLMKIFFSGVLVKAFFSRLKKRKLGLSQDVIIDYWAKVLSKKNTTHYDYAISYLEGWSNSYLAHMVSADKKYAWIHSTFSKTAEDTKSQLSWIKKVDNVVFVTDACKVEFEKLLPEVADKALTIFNVTDSKIIKQRAEQIDNGDSHYLAFSSFEGLKVITVCRLTSNVKGLDRIVNCAKALRDNGISFLWYIVGDGPDEGCIRALIESEHLEDYLVLAGRRFNPYPFIKIADIMCMPSRYEGKPIVITESMILGVPPIVTEYLSANEQIENGVDGVVVPNDDVAAVDSVVSVVKDSVKIEKLKENVRSREYGNSEYVSEIEKMLF